MPRPLMQHGVGQLEEMFGSCRGSLQVLQQLENELQYRQVPRERPAIPHCAVSGIA